MKILIVFLICLFPSVLNATEFDIVIEGNKCLKCPDDLKEIVENYKPPKPSIPRYLNGEIYIPPPVVPVIEVINHISNPPIFIDMDVNKYNRSSERRLHHFNQWEEHKFNR